MSYKIKKLGSIIMKCFWHTLHLCDFNYKTLLIYVYMEKISTDTSSPKDPDFQRISNDDKRVIAISDYIDSQKRAADERRLKRSGLAAAVGSGVLLGASYLLDNPDNPGTDTEKLERSAGSEAAQKSPSLNDGHLKTLKDRGIIGPFSRDTDGELNITVPSHEAREPRFQFLPVLEKEREDIAALVEDINQQPGLGDMPSRIKDLMVKLGASSIADLLDEGRFPYNSRVVYERDNSILYSYFIDDTEISLYSGFDTSNGEPYRMIDITDSASGKSLARISFTYGDGKPVLTISNNQIKEPGQGQSPLELETVNDYDVTISPDSVKYKRMTQEDDLGGNSFLRWQKHDSRLENYREADRSTLPTDRPLSVAEGYIHQHNLEGSPQYGFFGDISYLANTTANNGDSVEQVVVKYPEVAIELVEDFNIEKGINEPRYKIITDNEEVEFTVDQSGSVKYIGKSYPPDFPPPLILTRVLADKIPLPPKPEE